MSQSTSDETHHIVSAGVLPYAYSPQSNQIYFLMGQESYNSLWPRHSSRWSDFGGRVDTDETETQTAAREFIEESLNVVQLSTHPTSPTPVLEPISDIQTLLENKAYTFRILSRIQYAKEPIWRACYVKRVHWQPHIPRLFQETFEKLHKLHEMTQNQPPTAALRYYQSLPTWLQQHPAIEIHLCETNPSVRVNSAWLEKQQVRWWSMAQIKYVVRNKGKYKKTRFRMGFMTTLERIIQEFDRLDRLYTRIQPCTYVAEKPPELDKMIMIYHNKKE